MIINLTLTNSIPKDGYVHVKFPAALQWFNDISTNHQIPIDGLLNCSISGNNISYISSMSCIGSSSTQIVTLTPNYQSSSTSI